VQAGNPNLRPETSVIRNFGFTYEGIEDLSFSMDYQSVSYIDRIRTLDDTDTVFDQFRDFLRHWSQPGHLPSDSRFC
jgi:outer membrane receptor protein involved in Fe transport